MDFLKAEIATKRKTLDSGNGNGSSTEEAPPAKKYMRKVDLDRIKREEAKKAEEERLQRAKEERERKLFEGAKRVAAAEEAAAKTLKNGKGKEREGGDIVDEEARDTAFSSTSAGDASTLTAGAVSVEAGTSSLSSSAEAAAASSSTAPSSSKPEAFNISNAEAIRRLRAKDQPIRLFGESDKERRLRLRALELIEERTEGQRNDFMRALEGMDKGMDLEELQRRVANPALQKLRDAAAAAAGGAGGSDGTASHGGSREGSTVPGGNSESEAELALAGDGKVEAIDAPENREVDLALVKKNPSRVYPQIYFGIKRVLKEWEQSMAERPDAVKRSQQGKLAAAMQLQSAEYLKPLFKSLRKRQLEPDVLQGLAEIVYYMQKREYLKSNDSYLRLSIGNAPWPIGVTMVGIHERSGREKIFSNNVAHVLNDEVSRKYIQSLKRLLTFAQSIRPPDDLSQRMG